MKIFKVLPLLALTFTFSCKSKKETHYTARLDFSKSVKFSLDNETGNSTKCLMPYEEGGQEYLVYLNDQKPSLLYFDLAQQKLVKKQVLQKEGPDGVGHIKGFYIYRPDSIFVLNPQAYSLSLINKDGHVINHYLLVSDKQDIGKPNASAVSMPVMYTGQMPQLKNNTLNLVALPDMLPFKQEAYTKGKLNITLNLQTKGFNYSYNYPALYANNNYSYISTGVYRCLGKDGSIVYSFAASDSIYVETATAKKAYAASSNEIENVKPLKGNVNETSSQDFTQQPVLNAFYHYILYDKWRDVYYRIACRQQDLKDAAGQMNNFFDKPFSVIILNNKFEVIGEEKFPAAKYNLLNMFVGKEGLYLSQSFYKNVSENENELRFSIFKLKV